MKPQHFLTRLVVSFILFSSLAVDAQAQNNWGVGLRLGDPAGLTVKKYINKNALEVSIGRTHWWYGNGWHKKRFDDWYEAQAFGYKDFDYLGHRTVVPIGMQVHYLLQQGIQGATGLDWYYGFGGQLRFQRQRYDYRYKVQGGPNWIVATSDRIVDLDLGADAVIGLEYTFPKTPISLFLDLTLFMEVLDDPFLFWFQGGLGGRFNFS